jgi:GTP cyclohydrolase I
MTGADMASAPETATIIVDDLVDTGATRRRMKKRNSSALFLPIFDKNHENIDDWLVFPWEVDVNGYNTSSDDIFVRLLEFIGEDPSREGLKDTPKRMAKAWTEWTQGYNQKPEDFLTVFKDGSEGYNGMVLERNIPFYSHCEHHLAPFFGVCHIAYIPKSGTVLGISKLGRILDMYARRLQIQERLTTQIAECIEKLVQPEGVAVVIKARHLCTESRGLSKQGQEMVTSCMKGVFRESHTARSEFLNLIK